MRQIKSGRAAWAERRAECRAARRRVAAGVVVVGWRGQPASLRRSLIDPGVAMLCNMLLPLPRPLVGLAVFVVFGVSAVRAGGWEAPAPRGAQPLISHPAGREHVSLNGPWQFIVDPYDHGVLDFRSNPQRADGAAFWSERSRRGPGDLLEHAFSREHTLSVPGDWNTQRDDLYWYEGAVWYRREFLCEPAADERVFLCFGGANRVASVWVNGREIGHHRLGFTPFHFEITEAVRTREGAGPHAVVVRVDAGRVSDAVPALMTDWFNYGGITREVRLLTLPGVFVRELHAQLAADDPATIEVRATVDPARAGAVVTVALPELGLRSEARTDAAGRAVVRFAAPASLERWSPRTPVLYDVEAAVRRDGPGAVAGGGVVPGSGLTERVGFRTVSTRGTEILLNGEAVFLRGICIHEESLSRDGRAWSESDARELLGLAAELGCNFVRLSHYTHNEHMARVADELGMLVWAEIPVYWTLEYDNPETLAEAIGHLDEMIARDRSRASVIFWSVGNETHESGDGGVSPFRAALAEHVREADPTRLLSAALISGSAWEGGRPVRLEIDDPFGRLADVYAINEYMGWYWREPEDLRGVGVTLPGGVPLDKPLIVSETGCGVREGLYGSDREKFTEQFGVRFYRERIGWLRGVEGLAGVSPWILKDFRSPRRPLYGVQDGWNRKGLVSEVGARKLVFDELRRYYRSLE